MLKFTNKLERVKQIAMYLRKSRQDEGLETEATLANHRKILKKIAQDYNWIYEIYEEVASSIDMDIRTELTRMLKEVEKGSYDAVLVMDVDRLSRSVKDSAIIKAIFAENDVLIITADLQVIDLNEDNDSLVSDFMDVLSSFEYKQIRKRMMRGKRAGAEKGEWNNGVPPFGYKVDKANKTLIIVEEQAAVINLIFGWIIERKGIKWIATELYRLGIKTNNQRTFSEVAIRRLIRNETYKGYLIRHRIKWNGKKKEFHPQENWVIVKDAFPAIVSEEVWDEANEAINERSKEAMKTRARTFGLTGLVKCGYCGYTLSMMRRKDRKTDLIVRGCHRRCPTGKVCKNSSISYYSVINAVVNEIKSYEAKLKDEILKINIQSSKCYERKKAKKITINNQLKKVEKAINQVDIAFEEAVITVDEYKKKRYNFIAQKNNLIIEKKKTDQVMVNSNDEKKETLTQLNIFLNEHHTLSHKQMNSRLRSLIKKIELFNNQKESKPRIKIFFV
ncbi:MAG: recombinase family protein [Anaerobacillus sp.]|uniref:recombinase family protein n=1 Tax=Anaerobacillus sp. TaxID=1872506 RepID=UPI003918BA99